LQRTAAVIRPALVVAIGVVGCTLPQDHVDRPGSSYPTLEPDRVPRAQPSIDAGVPAGEQVEPPPNRRIADYVPMNVVIDEPRDVEKLVVELRIGDYQLPSSPNHVVERDMDMQRVTVHVAPGRAVTAAERTEALLATDVINAQNPTIGAAARSAIHDALGARERASSLVHWIHSHITFLLGNEPLASAVLEQGTGDCSEMSLLFIAMARSIGLPARHVVGLAANDLDGKPIFAYHAWAEVEIDGHWVEVDPTWDEEVADATHVKLIEGESDDWQRASARMAISVVEVTWSTVPVWYGYATSSLQAIASASYQLNSTFARPRDYSNLPRHHVEIANRDAFAFDMNINTAAPLLLDAREDRVVYASLVFLSDGSVFVQGP